MVSIITESEMKNNVRMHNNAINSKTIMFQNLLKLFK